VFTVPFGIPHIIMRPIVNTELQGMRREAFVAQFEPIGGHLPARSGQAVSLLSLSSRHQVLMQPQAL
jgi:hypothetical protein